MISKKILAFMLALSVIVCSLPMVSVFAANTSVFPYTAETLTFTAEDFADGKLPVYMTQGFYIDFSEASDSFKAMATSKADVTDKIYISGKITFGNVVLNITDVPAKGLASNNTFLNAWASSVAADDAELAAKMAAATDIANMEYNGDVIDTGATKACIRNFKRYVLHENGVTVTPEEDYLPEGETSWDKSPMYNRTLAATAAEITLTYKTARPTATATFDAETIFIPTAKIANAIPAKSASGHVWVLNQGIYQHHNENHFGKCEGCSSDTNYADSFLGADGPYFVFKAAKSGTYNVYASRRDRYYSKADGTKDTDQRRDIRLNISGVDLNFASKETLLKDNTIDYRLIAEDEGKTVTLTAGQEVVVRIMDGTGAWTGSRGLVLVPVGKTHDGLVGTVLSADNFTDAYKYNVTARQVSDVTINTAENAATAKVTVNGVEVTAKTEGAYLKDAGKFNNIKRYDLSGSYIKEPTVLDALVEADAADNKFAIDSIDATARYCIKINGVQIAEAEQIVVKNGDVITCDIVDKTNFMPLSMQGPGELINNYGSIGSTDGLREDGSKFTNMNKIVTYGSAAEAAAWPIDITVRDAFTGCYLTGYIKVINDDPDSTGVETNNVNLFINMPIKHSAIKTSNGRLEFAYDSTKDHGVFLSNVNTDLNGDGTEETYKRYLTNGKLSTWYDFTNVYLANSSFDPDNLVVTATEVSDGVYRLNTTVSVPVTLVRVVKDDNGAVTSIAKEHTIIDFAKYDGTTVTVADNETVYVWKGTELPAGTKMVPLCAPLTK